MAQGIMANLSTPWEAEKLPLPLGQVAQSLVTTAGVMFKAIHKIAFTDKHISTQDQNHMSSHLQWELIKNIQWAVRI